MARGLLLLLGYVLLLVCGSNGVTESRLLQDKQEQDVAPASGQQDKAAAGQQGPAHPPLQGGGTACT
eukprot:5642387-Prymnesium_polylepis.1